MDEVKNDYIEKALNELILAFGTREFVDDQKLIFLIHSNKIKECIKEIASYLGLPIEVNISYVPKGYRSSATLTDGFQSQHLVKTDRNNHGIGGITAQVSIPSYLPLYGTPSMANVLINVRLSENCAENPTTLISVMAHELSHIVLHSMWHKEKENEFYTDLTAMLFGFENIMKEGRKVIKTDSFTISRTTTTHTETTTYGYLSDENFNFAFNKIKITLNNQRYAKKKLLKKLNQFKKQLNKTKKLAFCFKKYLEYMDKHLDQEISQEDAYRISLFHQPGHTDSFQSVVRKNEEGAETFIKFVTNLTNYSGRNIEAMQQYEAQLKSASEEVERQKFLLGKDVDILKKYVNFFCKINLEFRYYWQKNAGLS